MSKRWTLRDDIFLAMYAEAAGANYVAFHDLQFAGKNAGENRVKKLKESGLWDKMVAHVQTHDELRKAWVDAFGSRAEKEFMEAAQ